MVHGIALVMCILKIDDKEIIACSCDAAVAEMLISTLLNSTKMAVPLPMPKYRDDPLWIDKC